MTSILVSAALAGAVVSCLCPQTAAARSVAGRHPTAGVPLVTFGQAFDSLVQAASDLTDQVSFVWSDNKPFGTALEVVMGEYSPAYRATYGHSTEWFYDNHPEWIVYLNDRKSVAYEFGDRRFTPLDIRSAAVMAWKQGEIETNFRGQGWVDLDNIDAENESAFAGHYSGAVAPCAGGARPACGGHWSQDYTGEPNDPAWIAADLAYVTAMTGYFDLHGRQVMINDFGGNPAVQPPSDQIALALAANGALSEGFPLNGCSDGTGWVAGRPHDAQFDGQYQEFAAESGRPFFALGYLCNHALAQISQSEEAWATAVFLMGMQQPAVNYLAVCGAGRGLTDCNSIEPYPASMNPRVGPITDPPPPAGSRPYARHFAHGLAALNPSSTSPETVTVPAGADQFGNPVAAGPLVLQPLTAIVVVTP